MSYREWAQANQDAMRAAKARYDAVTDPEEGLSYDVIMHRRREGYTRQSFEMAKIREVVERLANYQSQSVMKTYMAAGERMYNFGIPTAEIVVLLESLFNAAKEGDNNV